MAKSFKLEYLVFHYEQCSKGRAQLDGVFTLRGRDDARQLRARLLAKPRRVLIIGGGFTGSEIASACRELGLLVTVTERGTAPLVGALGATIAARMALLQREAGVDLRCQTTVTKLSGDAQGRVRRAQLSDGSTIDTEVVVVALGAVRNTEWLRECELATGTFGVACDASCRVMDINAIITDDIFVAGDVARFPHPLYRYQFLKSVQTGGRPRTSSDPYQFISLDPPEHDRLRHLAMRHFGPPERPEYLQQLRPEIGRIITTLLDRLQGQRQFDFVDSFAYPLPVTVICRILGVPGEDEPQFHVWASALIESIAGQTEEQRRKREQARSDLNRYMTGLIERRREHPGDDLLSRMATDTGPEGQMAEPYLIATASLLLVAGHETTVNLLGNGMLTLLRHPAILERLRGSPNLIPAAVEELLRYEPPVQFLANRTTLDEIPLAGTTIPRGVVVTLALAAGNRDPVRFQDPDRFDPGRRDNEHLGFGSGIHSCFGAPLARMEAQIAFTELVRRLEQPSLVVDPPPYRPSPLLRGPEHLLIEVNGVRASGEHVAPYLQR